MFILFDGIFFPTSIVRNVIWFAIIFKSVIWLRRNKTSSNIRLRAKYLYKDTALCTVSMNVKPDLSP